MHGNGPPSAPLRVPSLTLGGPTYIALYAYTMLKKLLSKFKNREFVDNRIVLDSMAHIEKDGILTESFGIRIYDGIIAPFSRAGDNYPSKGSYTFSTSEDFQDQIILEFHRSSQSVANQESYLATVRIRGYKLEKAKEPQIRVHYELSNGQVSIWATNEKRGSNLTLTLIKNAEGVSVH